MGLLSSIGEAAHQWTSTKRSRMVNCQSASGISNKGHWCRSTRRSRSKVNCSKIGLLGIKLDSCFLVSFILLCEISLLENNYISQVRAVNGISRPRSSVRKRSLKKYLDVPMSLSLSLFFQEHIEAQYHYQFTFVMVILLVPKCCHCVIYINLMIRKLPKRKNWRLIKLHKFIVWMDWNAVWRQMDFWTIWNIKRKCFWKDLGMAIIPWNLVSIFFAFSFQ